MAKRNPSRFQNTVDSQLRKAERYGQRTGNWAPREKMMGESGGQAAAPPKVGGGGVALPVTVPGQTADKAWKMKWQAQPTAPLSGFASMPKYQKIARDILGYVPSFYENPTNVAQMQHMIDTGQEAPPWVDRDMVKASYEYFKLRNQDKPWTEWGYLDPTDPARPLLQSLGTPPAEFLRTTMPSRAMQYGNPDLVKQGQMRWADLAPDIRAGMLDDPNFYKGEITRYPEWARQEILADPNFQWDQLPDWQRQYFDLSSNPAAFGALQGGLMGAMGGPAGLLFGGGIGAGIGYIGAKSGYDITKEFWQQENLGSQALGLMNWAAEQAEKIAGLGVQTIGAAVEPDQTLADVWGNLPASYGAGARTFEELGLIVADVPRMYAEAFELAQQGMPFNAAAARVMQSRESGPLESYLGSSELVSTGRGNILQSLVQAREEIEAGRPYREVMMEAQQGIAGQIGDMALQALADPLNVLPEASAKGVELTARAKGAETAAASFSGAGGIIEGIKRYQTKVQTGDVAPTFKYNEMTGLQRFFGQVAIDESGKPVLRAGKFTDKPLMATAQSYFASLDPVSRARVGLGLANDNILAMMTMFDSPDDVVSFWNSIKNGDMETARTMGARFAESPEFYTILPALKNFEMEKFVSTWEATRPNAAVVERIAQVLNDTPYNLLDDIATQKKAARTFERVKAALAESTDANARALLQEIEAGTFSADDLTTAGKIFNGEAAAPFDLGQWKATVADSMTTHFGEWARDFFNLQPDSMIFRSADTMKKAQSLLLLGFNPAYAINNGVNNMVTRAATGNFGYMTPHQIDAFISRLEIDPYRMSEGVGMAGDVKPGVKRAGEQVISKALRQEGVLSKANGVMSAVGDKIGFAQKASAWIEKTESRNAFAIGMKKAWGQMWQRGKGFRHMDAGLKQAIDSVYPGGSDIIYRAIEAGMNQREIENAIIHGEKQLRSRSFVGEVARRMGVDAAQATTMLDQIGLLDRLDGMLEKTTTDRQIDTTFRFVERQAQDWIDTRLAEDFSQRAEHVKNRVQHEGWQSVGDIYIDTELSIQERWLEHYSAFEDVFARLDDIEDPVLFNNLLEDTYRQQGREWRRINRQQLTSYKGLADALGLGETQAGMQFLADQALIHNLWDEAYTFRMEETAKYTDSFKDDWTSQARYGERDSLRARIDTKFQETFKKVQRAEKRMGEQFASQFRGFGPEVEKMAGQYWKEVTTFRGKMWKEMQEFRSSLAGLDYDTRRKVSQLFWHDRYPSLIKEFEALKINGASELNRRMNGRGGGDLMGLGAEPKPPTPTEGSGGSAVPIPDPDAVAIDSIFQIADEYGIASADANGNPLFGANNHILAIVRKYGGDEGARVTHFADLADTPELVRRSFETRAEAKTIENAKTAGEAYAAGQEAVSAIKAPKITENTGIMTAISRHGGLDANLRGDVLGEAKYRGQGFKKGGFALDDMARMLVEDGYPIDLNAVDDMGGTRQLSKLIGRATQGEDVYPVFHDYDAQLAREQTAAAEAAVARVVDENALRADEFISSVREIEETVAQLDTNDPFADQNIDFDRLTSLMDDLPEEAAGLPYGSTGETMRDYVMRVYGDAEVKAQEIRQTRDIATKLVAHDAESVEVQQFRDMVMTRETFREQLMDSFNLSQEEADAVTTMTDARAEAWAKMTGKSSAEWYADKLAGVTKGGAGELFQTDYAYPRIDLPDRTMSPQEVEGFARALSRTSVEEVRRAVSDTQTKAAKIALLDEVHKLAPDLAEGAATQLRDTLFQTVKEAAGETPLGAIDFLEDGRALIRAFEKGNVSTVVHELGHVFRRELAGADLAIVEEWAGVKKGKWTTKAEEQFARGFEKYLADGQAPTPKLKAVFAKFKTWLTEIYKQITGSPIDIDISAEVRQIFDNLLGGTDKNLVNIDRAKVAEELAYLKQTIDFDAIKAKAREIRAGRQQTPETLHQEADPRVPYGSYEQAAGYTPDGVFMDDAWPKFVKPLLEGMREEAHRQFSQPEFKMGGFDDATQRQLKTYMNQVKGDMATSKLSAVRYGESMRDFALLNYNRRYGFDKYLDVAMPYQFWYTRSMMNWGLRALERPAWFANYARLKMMQNRYQNNLPERLRGKIRIPAPWMPDWMGDAMYVDPFKQLFPFVNMMTPVEQMQRDKNYQTVEAERVLQEWANDGTVANSDIMEAVQTRSGPTWEKAIAEAKMRREAEISNPIDFISVMLGPAWYISTPMKALGIKMPFFNPKGEGPETISELPISRTGRAFETVTEGTWAEPVGQIFGLLGKPEEWVRKKNNLPEFGEYGDYYTKRQLANMVTDGILTTEQAEQAMLEKQGEAWEQAKERVKLELALRVPLAGPLYAGLHEGAGAALQASPAAFLGSGLLPEGELKYRGLKEKWDAAWKEYDAGNTQAVSDFFDDHPEYEAYLAKGKDEGDLLRSFLVGQIWDNYMSLDKANRKVVTGQMGGLFEQSFLNKETRSYDSIDTETLAGWSRMLKGQVPQVEATQTVTQTPQYLIPELEGIPAPLSGALNDYETWKASKYPGINDIQNIYYGAPKSERRRILSIFPQLKDYWRERRGYLADHPEVAQFIDSDTAEGIIHGDIQPIGMDAEQARRLLMYYRPSDFAAPARTADYYLEGASPTLKLQIANYALTEQQMGAGAQTELQMIWEENGKPGDSFQSFLDDILVPTLSIGQ